MKCQQCPEILVESNIDFSSPFKLHYTRFFCFNCDTLYECCSDSGDFTEENLEILGEVEYD